MPHVFAGGPEFPLATYTFSKATENGKSYALDAATVVSLENATAGEIGESVKKELEAGKTNINLLLASNADKNVFAAIKSELYNAQNGSISLTLLGCEKIPSEGFKSWTMLKSIALPNVTEIEEYAFSGCENLQKIELCSITKAYGENNFDGIFENLNLKSIDLILAEEQKGMHIIPEGRVCYIAGTSYYYNQMDHRHAIFLDYQFKSIKCRDKTYTP